MTGERCGSTSSSIVHMLRIYSKIHWQLDIQIEFLHTGFELETFFKRQQTAYNLSQLLLISFGWCIMPMVCLFVRAFLNKKTKFLIEYKGWTIEHGKLRSMKIQIYKQHILWSLSNQIYFEEIVLFLFTQLKDIMRMNRQTRMLVLTI